MWTIFTSLSFVLALELSKLQVCYPEPEFRILPINQKPRIVDIKQKEKHEVPPTIRQSISK